MKKKIIIQFNEANFDLIKKYAEKYKLENFTKILQFPAQLITSSENKYENLEPWIQWYSFYTCKSFDEHKVFHLGDCVKNKNKTFFEKFKNKNLGFFAPMNLDYIENSKIFIPDPWTQTNSDNSYNSKCVTKTIKHLINNNSELEVKLSDIFGIFYLIGVPKSFFEYSLLFKTVISFIKKDRVKLATYFDSIFLNYSIKRSLKEKIDFSIIFLNGLAHIQHHFMLSSQFLKESEIEKTNFDINDKILVSLKIYDQIFGKLLNKLGSKNFNLWFITALTQEPYKKITIYWRLKNYEKIINFFLGFDVKISKLMSRDVKFEVCNKNQSIKLLKFLKFSKILVCNSYHKAFDYTDQTGEKNIFSSFVYSGENNDDLKMTYENKELNISKDLIYIARKNASHHEKGWAFSNESIENNNKRLPIWELSNYIN